MLHPSDIMCYNCFMNYEDEAALSYYKEIEKLSGRSDVALVRHTETGLVYVRKTMSGQTADIYRNLAAEKIPGVPEIFHIFEDEDNVIVIEEFINGITLADYLRESGSLSEDESSDIIIKLCTILKYFHKEKHPVIHRDIKPSNVIIQDNGSITLIDFNASKIYDSNKTRDTVLMGTADFAAPEQYGFAQSDTRTDIYALGVLLNVMLTGKLPNEELYRGSSLSCRRAIRKCTSMDPEKRFKNTDALKRSLSRKNTAVLPPGFRTGKPWKMIISSCFYILMIYLCATLEIEPMRPLWWLIANRVASFFIVLSVIFFMSDYMGISSMLPVSKSTNRIISVSGRTMWSILSVLFILLLLTAAAYIGNIPF